MRSNLRKKRGCLKNHFETPPAFNSHPQAARSAKQTTLAPIKKRHAEACLFFIGDPYGNRTHITAVKGRCLNLLTNGPGSGNLTRTDDNTGMNRVLYQLSYAAILTFAAETAIVII